MRRYVYSPKVYVYINTGGRVGNKTNPPNIVDLTAYTTSGSVSRVTNAVSSAEITIRNPHKKWTKPGKPTFRPMDSITIFMMREKGFPVQVFTGYLNRTPYYAMYPGTVTLLASCTLKRLLHRYFDPALPYTFQFLAEHGWQPNGANGVVNIPAETADASNEEGIDIINDSGFGDLLYATLREIGGWEDNQIYIEALPGGIAGKVSNIFRQFAEEDDQALTDYSNLLQKLIGIGAQGSGGGDDSVAVGPGSNGKKIFDYFVKRGFSDGQAAGWVGNFVQESGLNPEIVQSNGEGHGLAQWGGSRFSALETFASSRGTKWQDLQTQLDFVWDELQGTEAAAYQAIRVTRTVHAAVDAIGLKYERFGIEGNRYGPADAAFKLYAGGSGAGNAATSSTSADSVEDTSGPNGNGNLDPNATTSESTRLFSAAKGISDVTPGYLYGGGHGTTLSKINPAKDRIDCSASTALALKHAGMFKGDSAIVSGEFATNWGQAGRGQDFTVWANSEHVFIQSEGTKKWRFDTGGPGGGYGPKLHMDWRPTSGFTPRHWSGPALAGSGLPEDGGTGAIETNANTAAFAAVLNWPSLEESAESILMQGRRSLMNDKSLFPFIEQMTGASLRQFQSLPNGVFFAFYPDYFGEMGHRKPYWNIDDVEILDGGIELTDDNLVTHEFVTGDTVYGGGITMFERLQSGGIVSVFNAFGAVKGLPSLIPEFDGKKGADAAIAFLQKYGARPDYAEAPMIRSPYFEAFLAYQKFMLAWSRQFATNFTFTFMPELYPGGRVGFPDHGLQCYIESVTHNWDYASGFTTSAVLSAPSPYGATGDALAYSSGLVRETDGGTVSIPSDANSK